jgi:hypothetical protein
MRAKSTSITTALNWTLNAVIGKLSPIMLATSTFGTYVFFGSWCLLAAIFCYLFVLETKVYMFTTIVYNYYLYSCTYLLG